MLTVAKSTSVTYIRDLVVITLILAALFSIGLASHPLEVPDSARYAEIPREMLARHDYITPHLNGIKYFEKPPLFYWLQVAGLKFFGVNEFGASFANALMGLVCCAITYLAGRRLFGRQSGILASLALGTSILYFALIHIITLDLTFTTFLTGALFCFLLGTRSPPATWSRNCYFWGMYSSIALATLTKGLIGLVFPALIIGCYIIIFNDWKNLLWHYCLPTGILLFLAIAMPWHIFVQVKNPEFLHFYFIEQHFLRYLTSYALREQPWWFFSAVLLSGLYPWIAFLPQAIIFHLPANLKQLPAFRAPLFLLLWPALIFVFYNFSHSKLIPYLLPMFPPLAVLVGNFIATHWEQNQSRPLAIGFTVIFIINTLLGIGSIAAIYFFNFAHQIVTKELFYRAATILILGAMTTFIIYQRGGVKKGIIALIISMALFYASLVPTIPVINNKSSKPLAMMLLQHLQQQRSKAGGSTAKRADADMTEIISYGEYYQDLPFYLRRTVTVVNQFGELTFGTQHQDASAWMIDEQTFKKRWLSKKSKYMLINEKRLAELMKDSRFQAHMQIMGQYAGRLLVSNHGRKD